MYCVQNEETPSIQISHDGLLSFRILINSPKGTLGMGA
jgi:hypothetical protein